MKKRFMLTAAGVTAAAIAGAANADITVTIDEVSLIGYDGTSASFVSVDLGEISGTLTGISYDYAWSNNTGDSSWSSDMLIHVSGGSNSVQVGGYNVSFSSADQWGALAGGPSTGSYSGYASGSTAMNGAGVFTWMNGWSSSAGTTSSGTFVLHGINAVPAPGALALLGLAGLAGRRRRRA